jgi:regulator of sigma E protease
MSLADLPAFLFAVALLIAVLWRRVGRDGTEFTLAMLPLGGYVRMLDERDGLVSPAERQQAFNQRPLRQRAAIVAAGPAVNWLVAILMFTLVAWIGAEVPKAVIGTPGAGSAAERAGLRAGDWVRAVSSDGQAWSEVRGLPDLLSAAAQAQALREPLHLTLSDAQGRGERHARLDLDASSDGVVNERSFRAIGLLPLGEPVIATGPGRRRSHTLHRRPTGPGRRAGAGADSDVASR